MPTITTEALQAYAAQRMAHLRTRAAGYLTQALLHPGAERALTLARMIDALADEACGHQHLAGACRDIAHDEAAAIAIERAWRDTAALLTEQAYAARMASIPGLYQAGANGKPAAAAVPA
jgi:hypothetical protein